MRLGARPVGHAGREAGGRPAWRAGEGRRTFSGVHGRQAAPGGIRGRTQALGVLAGGPPQAPDLYISHRPG